MGSNPARIPPESPVKCFSTDTRKTLSIQCYTHVGVGAKNVLIVYHPTQEFHQPINISNVSRFMLTKLILRSLS